MSDTRDVHIAVGTSSSNGEYFMPYRSYYHKNKIQFIITKEEMMLYGIESGADIYAITLKSSSYAGRVLNNLRIRIKETTKQILTSWETENMTLVYDAIPVSVAETNTGVNKKYDFILPFKYNGEGLLIEVSRDETTGSNSGSMFTRAGLQSGRMISWYADRGYSFPFDNAPVTAQSFILDVDLSISDFKYKLNGVYTTDNIVTQKETLIKWLEDKPEGTDIVAEYSIDLGNTVWTVVVNGDKIPSSSNLKIRFTLSTVNEKVTPEIMKLWLEDIKLPQHTIMLILGNLNTQRFANATGDINVDYEASLGTLKGKGGPVKSFSTSFLPIELTPKLNPCQADKFTVNLSTQINFKKVEYKDEGVKENFSATARCSLDLQYVGIVNP